jgi:hypothetical protein
MDTIRIIHNLPRSGGSIISKSISAQKDISLDNTITFEKFTSDPDKTLNKISSILNFKFDPNYLENFKKIKITGDEEAFDAINIRIKQNTSYKSLTNEQREQINKKLKYNTIMTKISEFYLNKK